MLGNKYVAVGIGILLVLVVAYNVKFFSSKSRSLQMPMVKNVEPAKHPLPFTTKVPERVSVKEDKSRWKRDPFGLQLSGKTEYKGIQLMGIIKRNGRSHALINGRVYSINDRVGDSVIKEIKKHSIVLLSGGKIHEISFEAYTEGEER